MDEGHRPEAGLRGCTGAADLETLLDRFEEGSQHRLDACPERRRRKLRIMPEEIAQDLWARRGPIAVSAPGEIQRGISSRWSWH